MSREIFALRTEKSLRDLQATLFASSAEDHGMKAGARTLYAGEGVGRSFGQADRLGWEITRRSGCATSRRSTVNQG